MPPLSVHGARAKRAWLVGIASSVMLLALVPTTAVAGSRDPVILVHGYRGSPSTWADMRQFLESQGRTVVAIDLPSEDNVVNARAIRDLVAAKRWRSVDLVGQSMGGLSARHYVRFLAANNVKVRSYVSLGTPHYGITSACLLPSWYGGQMCPSSSFLGQLNAGDDTPGATYWTTIYSTSDEYVPTASSRLDGGACHVQFEGVLHNDMDNHAGIMAATGKALDDTCAGAFRS